VIGAAILAFLGQIVELSGALFPFILLKAAIILGFSTYAYNKISNAYPSMCSLYRVSDFNRVAHRKELHKGLIRGRISEKEVGSYTELFSNNKFN
jgi:hypothetical protein